MTDVGDVLASKYRLEEHLGSGGMGHVFRATNELVGRAVAIKVLRTEHSTNAPIVERFLREARAANLVRHPNVVDVLDVGRDVDGAPFIVQELLRGQDLAHYVQSRGGRLELAEIGDYFLPVIEAVAEAHARGVVHRDLKPENVFLAEEGRRRIPKLLDFGISKVRLPDVRATEVGVMMGTPAYMAPEQIQVANEADPRSDVWALGVMLFELLSGRLPFDIPDAPALFVAIVTRDPPPLEEVLPSADPAVARIVERCLRRNRDERYASALELARDLGHVVEGREIEPTARRLPVVPALAVPDLTIPDLAIPDLALPAKPAPPAAPKTVLGSPEVATAELALSKTEILERPAPPARAVPEIAAPSPSPPPRPREAPAPRPLDGVMMAPGIQASARRPLPPVGYGASRGAAKAADAPDMSLLVGLAVVGLTTIFTTAGLTAFVHQPGGFPLVALVTKPTPSLNLVVHGGLALTGFVITARLASAAVRRWRGDGEIGNRGGGIVLGAVAGSVFFAAIELARAAF